CRTSVSSQHFEQKLEYLDLSPGCCEIAAPRVEAVPPDQEAVHLGMVTQFRLDPRHGGGPILRVLENRQPLAMLMGTDAVQPLQHLIAVDGETACRIGGPIEIGRASCRERV